MNLNSVYLLASLPRLSWGETPRFTRQQLLERWKTYVSVEIFESLTAIMNQNFSGSEPFLVAWRAEEETLIKQLAAERRRRFRQKFFGAVAEPSSRTSSVVKTFFELQDPLEREKWLDLARWNRASALAFSDSMGTAGLFAYFIQTGLLEKYAALDAARGRLRLDEATAIVSRPPSPVLNP
jgi:hypothetical protein